jgi:hypothetical protein
MDCPECGSRFGNERVKFIRVECAYGYPPKAPMHQGMLVFARVMAHLPLFTFRRCVTAHPGDHKVQEFSCLDQFFAMAFAQLTARESLRDIEVNLRAQSARLYHMGFRCKAISRNTLSNANAVRPWQMYAGFAQHLIGIARPLYANEPLAVDLDETIYAFDATTIDPCLSVYTRITWMTSDLSATSSRCCCEVSMRFFVP